MNPNTIRFVLHAADNTATPLDLHRGWDCCAFFPSSSLRIAWTPDWYSGYGYGNPKRGV
ncbi:hypothetical protein [Rhizobacter sp. SG703]|uniref:hypothetical protein n=1 Tax=Rhizobacter sp. SG703 TaxID=2587140 RepID=UPI001445340C|nr:hypothetical protein [Rhizobacter sp. SG703]NKI93150.1 hypothetical protein [Rhizobacter sp. SG703]